MRCQHWHRAASRPPVDASACRHPTAKGSHQNHQTQKTTASHSGAGERIDARRVSSGQPEHNKLPVVAAHESLHDSVATTMTVPRHAQLGGHRRHRHLTHLLLGVRQAHHGSGAVVRRGPGTTASQNGCQIAPWARAIAVRLTSASTWIAPSLSTHISKSRVNGTTSNHRHQVAAL